MDIEGVRRTRYAYRRPQLAVVIRSVEVRAAIPLRASSAPKYFDVKPVMASAVPAVQAMYPGAPQAPQHAATQLPHKKHTIAVKAKVKHKLSRFQKIMYGSAATVVAVGALLAYQALMANTAVEIQVKKLQTVTAQGTDVATTSLPSDEKPKDPNYQKTYAVAPQLPRLLTINKIGVTARVLQVGVDKNNQMEVPKTAYDVAWYNGSSRPGENGAMVIDGHVQGVGGPAVFSNLKKLAAGDAIDIERGDGKHVSYKVVKVETIPTKDVDTGKLLVSIDTGRPGLNLITCGGNYDQKADQFDSRTIVYAVQQ